MNWFIKIVRVLAIIVISIILLNLILFITFSIPPIQKKVANIALEKLEPKIGTAINLDGIRVRLFNTVELKGLYVEDQHQDTLLYTGRLTARIRALDLLRNKLSVQKVGLENFTAKIYRESPETPFNFQFIINAFASEKDTAEVKEKKPLHIVVDDVIIKNGKLSYNILSEPHTPGQFNSNHINVEDFNFRANTSFLNINDMEAEVKLLTFYEKNSGIYLRQMMADVLGKDSMLKSGGVKLTLNETSIQIDEAIFDTKSKEFTVSLQSEYLDPKDVAKFYSPLNKLDKILSFDIDADGQLPMVNLKKLNLRYGDDTEFDVLGMISDYSNFNNSNLQADIRSLSVTQNDLESIISVWATEYISPQQLVALGNIDLRIKALGKLSNFRYSGDINTEQGDISLNGVGRMINNFKYLSFEGPVKVNDISVAGIIGESAGIGNTTMQVDAKVVIPRGSAVSVTADGNIGSLNYKDFSYNDLQFNGVYMGNNVSANIKMDSPLNQFDLFGDITFGQQLGFDIDANFQRLDLRPFLMIENWRSPLLTTSIKGQMSGSSIDNLAGTIIIDNTSIVDSNFIYNPGPIYLQATAAESSNKKIQIMSSFIEAEIIGDYYLSSIANDIKEQLSYHLPSIIKFEESDHSDKVYQYNDFKFNVKLNNTEDLSSAFALPFYNVEQALISGSVDLPERNMIRIEAHFPRLMFGNNDIRETKLDVSKNSTGLDLSVNTYLVQDNGYINARLNTDVLLDSVINRLAFDLQNSNNKSNGELLVTMEFDRDVEEQLTSDIRIYPVIINFNDKKIGINDAKIAYKKDKIDIRNFGVTENEMLLLGIDGIASKSEADNVRIYFNNTDLANILAAFNVSNFAGSINGDIYIRQALETPMIRTEELRVENITVHNDTIGTLMIEGNWDQIHSGLSLNTYLINKGERSFNIEGYIPTGDASPFPMNLILEMEKFELHAIQPLTAGAFSDLSGQLNSSIKITGKPSEPITEGWLGIDNGELKVSYSNVTYYLSDTIQISRDKVGLDNLVIRDQNNKTATINLSLSHSNFGRIVYAAGITLDDFLLLNNENRTDLMVYGNMKLSGKLNITGSPLGIYGDGNLITRSPSEVTVMLPQTAKAIEYSGVIYINTHQEDSLAFLRKLDNPISQLNTTAPKSSIPIIMRATVNLTPQFEGHVILDPTTGNALEVSGEGEININYNSKSTPPVRLYGDYVINSGKFHYNLQNLRAIDFNIRQGSRLTMEGDPMNTQFNIIAYLPVRADLVALSPTFATELANTRVPVNALLQIRGDLEAMDLQYDIELPESSNDVQQRVNSFINDEETKILQFAYLATTGSFIPSEGSPDLNFGSNVFSNFAASTLSRGLDALFASALSDNWSISTNLESMDGTFDNVRMGLDVSTRLLNNRLRMSTNLSYGDNSTLATQQAFIGEFELEYDINNWLMFRGFNRANDRFYRRTPTTQGIGVVVTKEAQSLRDLFNFRFIRPKEDEK